MDTLPVFCTWSTNEKQSVGARKVFPGLQQLSKALLSKPFDFLPLDLQGSSTGMSALIHL